MTTENKMTPVTPVIQLARDIQSKVESNTKPVVYRFDIFKGAIDDEGLVSKIKSVGSAYVREGMKTYAVTLRTFLEEKYFLLANSRPKDGDPEFVILTREPARIPGKKYFWHNVGDARLMGDYNHGLLKLNWDVLGCDLYMNLSPVNVTESIEAEKADEAA